MKSFIEEFINYLSVERGLAHNTLLAYHRDLIKYTQFLSKKGINDTDRVTHQQVTDFMYAQKKNNLSARSICRSLAAIKMFHRFLVRERLAKEDPTALVETPKLWKRIPDVLSSLEIEAMMKASGGRRWQQIRDHAILELLYASGMRVSELADLKLENVNFEAGYLRCIGKGSKERLVPVGKKACEAVQKYCETIRGRFAQSNTNSILFLSRLGRRISRQSMLAKRDSTLGEWP